MTGVGHERRPACTQANCKLQLFHHSLVVVLPLFMAGGGGFGESYHNIMVKTISQKKLKRQGMFEGKRPLPHKNGY